METSYQIKPLFVFKIFGAKNLNLSSKNLVISLLHEKRTELDINKIKKISVKKGIVFDDIIVDLDNYSLKFKKLTKKQSLFLKLKIDILSKSEELLKLYKKYYDKKLGRWRHDPQEQLITQRELEQSQELSVRHCIQRLLEAEFPRKGKIGKLAKVSQRTFARFLMGYHERFEQLIFDEDEK